MALAHELEKADFSPIHIKTTVRVNLVKAGKGFEISEIKLITEAKIPNIQEKIFCEHAENAKNN